MITIIEKPDWVTWDDVKQCLFNAHAVNREKGINMSHYHWTPKRIKESLGDHGIMLVALDNNRLVGTAAISERYGSSWYVKGRYAYMCFAGVIPEYSGQGIYSSLVKKREEIALSLGYNLLVLDTHSKNLRIQQVAKKNGYKYVSFFRASSNDHYSVVMAKWLNECPYSRVNCAWRLVISIIKAYLHSILSRIK